MMRTEKPISCSKCPLAAKGEGFVCPHFPSTFEGIKLLVQGEAPGKDEVDESKPFVGKAGHWIRKNILYNAGIHESAVLFDNTLRCLPPLTKKGDHYPQGQDRKDAEKECRQYDQWDKLPKNVPLLLTGGKALASRLGLDNISEWHGHIQYHEGRLVGCTFHPAAVMRQPNYLPVTIRETMNLMQASRCPEVLDRPIVYKGFTPYKIAPQFVTDLEWDGDKITVVGVAYSGKVAYSSYNVEEGLDVVRQHIAEGTRIIGHNIIGADLPKIGVLPRSWKPEHCIDTEIVGHLIHAHLAGLSLLDLGGLTRFYYPTSDWKHDKSDMLAYNGYDCAYNYRLWEGLERDLTATEQWHLVEKQQRLAALSHDMQVTGVKVDLDAIEKFRSTWKENRQQLAQQFPFNPNSPKQIIAWHKERGIYLPDTSYDTIEKTVRFVSEDDPTFPVLRSLLAYKDEGKSIDVWYGEKYITEGFLHPEFKPTGTDVSRFSCADPNCQNITPHLRHCIVAPEGFEIVSFDKSQLENRCVAWLAGDDLMLADFESGADIHRLTASRIFRVRYEDVTSDLRKRGKMTIHMTNYLGGHGELAEKLFGNRTKASMQRAKELQDAYFKAYPKTREWQKRIAKQLDSGDVLLRNPFGRVRMIYAQDSHERAKRGCHFLGCSTGAENVNQNALDIQSELHLNPILMVHDELAFYLPKGEEGLKLRKQIKEIMEEPILQMNGFVLPVKCKVGLNYGEKNEMNPMGLEEVEL